MTLSVNSFIRMRHKNLIMNIWIFFPHYRQSHMGGTILSNDHKRHCISDHCSLLLWHNQRQLENDSNCNISFLLISFHLNHIWFTILFSVHGVVGMLVHHWNGNVNRYLRQTKSIQRNFRQQFWFNVQQFCNRAKPMEFHSNRGETYQMFILYFIISIHIHIG